MPTKRGPLTVTILAVLLLCGPGKVSFGQKTPGAPGEDDPGTPSGSTSPVCSITAAIPNVPSCAKLYLGEANGICTYQTASLPNCGAPTGFGQHPAPELTPLGCVNGQCLNDLLGGPPSGPSEPGSPEPPGVTSNDADDSAPTTFADAVTLLGRYKAKLTEIAGSSEVDSTRTAESQTLADYTTEFEAFMNNAESGTQAERFEVFRNGSADGTKPGYMATMRPFLEIWRIVRLTPTSTSWLEDKPMQTTLVDAAALTFNSSSSGTAQQGPVIKVDLGTGSFIYFKTFFIGANNSPARMQVGQEVNAPTSDVGVVTGVFVDRHAFSHRVKVDNTPYLVTTKTDLSFQVK